MVTDRSWLAELDLVPLLSYMNFYSKLLYIFWLLLFFRLPLYVLNIITTVRIFFQRSFWHPTKPVSYTHLDVYKRQGEGIATELAPQGVIACRRLTVRRDRQTLPSASTGRLYRKRKDQVFVGWVWEHSSADAIFSVLAFWAHWFMMLSGQDILLRNVGSWWQSLWWTNEMCQLQWSTFISIMQLPRL